MTVEELGRRMGAGEFMRWGEFDEQHISQSWQQTALICSVIHNSSMLGGKRKSPWDFLRDRFKRRDAPPSPEALKAKFSSFRDRHNAFHGAGAPSPQTAATP